MTEMTPDFFDLTYLSKGSAAQQAGLRAIVDSGIMNSLKEFSPVVVGTLPLNLLIPTSDIDIICCFPDADIFQSQFRHSTRKDLNGVDSVISNFDFDGFQFEIVGQAAPVTQQVAYRHLVAEWNILQTKPESFRTEIIKLKQSGLKTEPAFAKLLGLQGDPYVVLLDYSSR